MDPGRAPAHRAGVPLLPAGPPALKHLEGGEFTRAWGGISGLQFALSAVWTEARRRGHTLEQMSQWMSHAPARFLGLDDRKGAIAVGYDADLVAWEPDGVFQVNEAMIQHRHKLTPYAGLNLQGVVRATWVRGQRVYNGGAPAGAPPGKVLLRDPQPPQGEPAAAGAGRLHPRQVH